MVLFRGGEEDMMRGRKTTDVKSACRPHLHCAPASPRCLLASGSTAARCLTDSPDPTGAREIVLIVLAAQRVNTMFYCFSLDVW